MPVRAGNPQYIYVRLQSKTLTAFWGVPTVMDGHVLLPDSYYKQPQRRYPVMYWIQGFDGYGNPDEGETLAWQRAMRAFHAEFILVFLDGMFKGGHQEFADSANNGPWGTALTTEFIPQTETHFRAIGLPSARFVAGHSSGGWSALWLQITYPDLFAGEWSVSPDPVDFRDFWGVDLTATPAKNFYASTWHPTDQVEAPSSLVYDSRWGRRQFASFNSVFSPRGSDGTPEPLFDWKTGSIDPVVARYWDEHYDISRIVRENWQVLQPKVRAKLHIFVGTNDNFHLNDPVVLFEKELLDLGSDAEIQLVRGRDHWSIFDADGDLRSYIFKEAVQLEGASAAASGADPSWANAAHRVSNAPCLGVHRALSINGHLRSCETQSC
ncbi:MAG TPA: alpha/beta hydrolase [Candidatus Cybelea sp.]